MARDCGCRLNEKCDECNCNTPAWKFTSDPQYLQYSGGTENIDSKTPVKSDTAKPDLSLLNRYALEQTALAFMDGAVKYGRNNFRENGGLEWNRLIAAALRHLTAFNDGENVASDSKLSHLGHAAANIFMLLEYVGTQNGIDNRFKKEQK